MCCTHYVLYGFIQQKWWNNIRIANTGWKNHLVISLSFKKSYNFFFLTYLCIAFQYLIRSVYSFICMNEWKMLFFFTCSWAIPKHCWKLDIKLKSSWHLHKWTNTDADLLQADLSRRNLARLMNVRVNKADQEVLELREGEIVVTQSKQKSVKIHDATSQIITIIVNSENLQKSTKTSRSALYVKVINIGQNIIN